jgi:hypothetical protein
MIVVGLISEPIPKTKAAARIDFFFKCAMPKYKRKKPIIKTTANSKSTIISPVSIILEVEMELKNPVTRLAEYFFVSIKANSAVNTGMQAPITTCDHKIETGAVPVYSKRA